MFALIRGYENHPVSLVSLIVGEEEEEKVVVVVVVAEERRSAATALPALVSSTT